MDAYYEVSTLSGRFWYDLFYAAGIFLAGVAFMLDGKRKGYPLARLSAVFITGVTFFVLGTKWMTYDGDAWRIVFTELRFPQTGRKTVLGGMLGGLAGIWLARKLLRFPYPVLDAFAVSIPLALGLQRVGCFLAGCCFGTPTDLPWAVRYDAHAHAYYDHLRHGWIDLGSPLSLPVHPSQAYEAILCLLIALVAWKMKNTWRRPGSHFYVSMGLYLLVRAFAEWWRNPGDALYDEAVYPGLSYLQCALFAGAVAVAILVHCREKTLLPDPLIRPSGGVPTSAYVLLLSALILWLGKWLNPVEVFVLQGILVAGLPLHVDHVLRSRGQHYSARATMAYALLLILLVDVTLTAQKTYRELTAGPDDRNVFNELSLDYGNTALSHYHAAPSLSPVYSSGGCGGPIDSSAVSYVLGPTGPLYTEKLQSLGAGFRQIRTYGEYNKWEWSTGLAGAWTTSDRYSTDSRARLMDLSVTSRYDMRFLGIGLGLHGGTVMHEDEEGGYLYTIDHPAKGNLNVSGSVRIMPYDILYFEARFNELLPHAQARLRSNQLLIGTGFGLKNGTCLEVGTDSQGGYVFAGRVVIGNALGVRAVLVKHRNANLNWHVPELSLSYRFPVTRGRNKP